MEMNDDLKVDEIIEEQKAVEVQQQEQPAKIQKGTHFTLAGIVFRVRKIVPRKNEIVCRVVGTVPNAQQVRDTEA